MAVAAAQLPQMEVFNRVLELPMVELALSKSAETYSKVKDSHQLVHWALSMAETSLYSAKRQAVPLAAPIAKKLENHIHFVDHTLCLGLDKIEQKVPLVKEKPEQILENAYMFAINTVQPAVSTISHVNDLIIAQAASLKNRSWNTANQILGTHLGTAAVKSLDNTAVAVDGLIDKYFPLKGEEEDPVVSTEEEDKLLHTLQTVGRLSNKTARRVYKNVVHHLGIIGKDNLKSYVSSLVEFLHITHYLEAINEKVQAHTAPAEDDPRKKTN